MSIKVGNQIIAGNVAVKMQDRIFIARRSFENGQEFYDIEVPKGCSLGFTQATKIALIIVGTNTTTSPKLRYQTTILDIVGGNFNRDLPIKVGSLVDGLLSEMYMGTSSTKIYLAGNRNNYIELENTPILQDDEGEETPILGGVNTYESLHLPYLKDNKLVMNNRDFLKINPSGFVYGNLNYKDEHKFLSEKRLVWEKSINESYQLATVKDIEDLAIADKFVSVLTYSRNHFADLDRITDSENGDVALVLETNGLYLRTQDGWVLDQNLNYDDSNNGYYYEIEDIDGIHSGKAVWNTTNGGQFDLFINYSNSIDNYTLGRNSNQALQVNKLLNSLTIRVPKENKEVVFDGSEDKVLQIDIDLSNYYTISEIDSYYNGNEESSIAAFYKEGDNIKIKGLSLKEENLVVKKDQPFLNFGDTIVDASLIKYTKDGLVGESVADFLNGNFAYIDKENNFSTTQKIAGQLIATQNWVEGWAQGTLLPNTFNLDLLTSLNLELNSPTLGKTSIRYQGINLSTGKTTTKDIELPVVSNDNNGLVTPSQKTLWDSVTSKTPLTLTEGNIVSTISYEDGTPKLMTNSPTQFAGVDVRYTEDDILQLKLLASQEGTGLYSGMISDKTGAYVYQNEALSLDDYHKVVNQGYVQDNSVMQNTIQPDENWSNDRVILNDLTFVNITASGASLQQKGSSLSTKGSVTTLKPFPIVNSTKAGLATAAMFNQIEANRNDIASIQGQGSVGAHLGEGPTQEALQNAWDNGKPGTPAMEGANVINLTTGNTWRYMYVEGTLQWVNLGVLGGNAIATVQNTGLVKSTENTLGMIQVESDGTMSLIGWDSINTDIQNLDLDLGNLEQSLNTHTSDMGNGNTTPHVTLSDRNNWNSGVTTANNAIPKVSSAVNNNLVLWSTNGVLKDSGKAFVTDFTTPTDNGIPSALAVQNAITSAVQAETNARIAAITAIYSDIPTVNNATLTIQKNGTNVGTFTANASSNSTINIDVPIYSGGVNYFRDPTTFSSAGSFSDGLTGSVDNSGAIKIVATSGNGNWNSWSHTNDIEANMQEGETFVFSIEIKADSGSTGKPTIYFKNGMNYNEMTGSIGSTYSTLYYTGTWQKAADINFHFGWSGCVGTFYIRKISFEKGKIPSDSSKYLTTEPLATKSFVEGKGYVTSSGSVASATNATKLNNQEASYYLNYNNLSNKPTIPSAVTVVNNLTSTSTSSALSAAQGKALNDKFTNYVTLTDAQTISGTKTFSGGITCSSINLTV